MKALTSSFSALALSTLMIGMAGVASAADAPSAVQAPAPAGQEVQHLVFKNEMVNGKKTWLPATATAKAGEKLEITLVNTLKDPHGFRASGLVAEPQVIGGGQTKTVVVDAPKAGTYKVDCQLHPAHVGATITVQ
jgi:plastocyanin